jgi:hypothetical protein
MQRNLCSGEMCVCVIGFLRGLVADYIYGLLEDSTQCFGHRRSQLKQTS